MRSMVVGFVFCDNKVALVRKKRPEWMSGLLNGVGGGIESFDKTPLYAMIREYKEECGVEITGWNAYCFLNCSDSCVYFFRAFVRKEIFEKIIRADNDEEIEHIEVSNLFNEKKVSNLSWLIPLALDETITDMVFVNDSTTFKRD